VTTRPIPSVLEMLIIQTNFQGSVIPGEIHFPKRNIGFESIEESVQKELIVYDDMVDRSFCLRIASSKTENQKK
jgi:hypothetical protein